MSGGADGNLSDSSSAVSGLSLRDGNNQGQLVNHKLNLRGEAKEHKWDFHREGDFSQACKPLLPRWPVLCGG